MITAKESVDECLQMQIDYAAVNKCIEQLRQFSIESLKNAIIGN